MRPSPVRAFALYALGGLAATLATLWLMQALISGGGVQKGVEAVKMIDFVRLKEDTAAQNRTRREDIKPPEAPPPPPPPMGYEPPPMETPPFKPATPRLALDLSAASALGDAAVGGAGGFAERGLVPVSGMPPQYPRRARMLKKEGSVELEFTITESGLVKDIVVIEAMNGEFFERAAIETLSRWRFKPKLVGGKPVEQRARQSFEFKLDQ
ncbi:MAG: energy transducer TonB [Campylobacterales bacterium]